MKGERETFLRAALTVMLLASLARASALDELKAKRQEVFEFAQKPTASRQGDRVTIAFTSKGSCDATVAIEDAEGRIVRHLASGVLGPNAPEPFKKSSKRQTIVWDGKNDQGRYVDDKDACSVRVSLGLKPRFERTLLWSPHKQRSGLPLLAAAPEGVYVCDGGGVDHVRLFDRDGNYVRTVYPFPADKLEQVVGLRWHDFPQGYRRPLKESGYQQTFLTSGTNDSIYDKLGRTERAATALAVRRGRIALAYEHLNRLATDGASPRLSAGKGARLPLKGPVTGYSIDRIGYGGYGKGKCIIGPSALAFAPDGKTLYMTGYLWKQRLGHSGCIHAVFRLDFEKDDEVSVFAGSRDRKEFGRDNRHLAVPTSVACDAGGRVYVSDFLNDRVQVFAPDGTHLASLRASKPARVLVHQKTGEVFAFSYASLGVPKAAVEAYNYDPKSVETRLTRFSPYPKLRRTAAEEFPLGPAGHSRVFEMGQLHEIELDSWAPGPGPAFWVASRKFIPTRADHRILFIDYRKVMDAATWASGVRIVRKRDGKWASVLAFGARARETVKRITPLKHNIQHLYVNPATGKLSVGEADSGPTIKAFKRLLEIDPATGAIRLVPLPFNALDAAFDLDGLIYLRTTDVVVRYDPRTWREVPWDYGERLEKVTCGIYGKTAPAIAGLRLPSTSPVCFHQGGMSVSPKGHLAVACGNRGKGREIHHDFGIFGRPTEHGKPYQPRMYPGREVSSTSCCVHVWDKHGKLVYDDAIWGLPQIDGVHIDHGDNLYVMATPTRIFDGTRYFNRMSETLAKFRPGRGKLIHSSRGPIPLGDSTRPERKPDLDRGGPIWAERAEWFYGGVGFAGFNTPHAGGGCACWFARFALDYFARSFAPEPDQFSVAVLDTRGNLILRIGQYGNVEDGMPLVRDGGPPNPRAIGGDEVSLMHAAFVGTHTDRRLFIADLGNARILSVKLDYHQTERVALKDIAGQAK